MNGTAGTWLLDAEQAPRDIFTYERLNEEHRLISQTALDFMKQEVLPRIGELEAHDWSVARALLKRCGDLGLLGVDVPEAYGGVALDKVSSVLVAEAAARNASFATGFGAMTGLAIVPLLCFGTEEQRARYLPGLVAGDVIGAYALSESGSGSDALGARARASRTADGDFVLDGEKMWITNGGFADLFIVFAKVDGEHFSAFLVERGFAGVSTGKEEHKMGLHGSSTAPLLLQGVRVPAGNLLGEVGKGHKVAFNVLNYGRFKLGAMCTGGARLAIADAARYAAQRRQFNRPIAQFGAIRFKLGEMAARLYAVESLLYRLAGDIDEASAEGGTAAMLQALEAHAVEASIAKVAGSETLDFILDENVQIHGGNGFVRDYPAERYYRDARVNRIFEGTNEINRLLIPGMLMRKALKGDLPLIAAARKLQDELLEPARAAETEDPLAQTAAIVEGMRKLTLMTLGSAMQRFGDQVQDEQEVLGYVADLAIGTYASGSAVLRARQAAASGGTRVEQHVQAAVLATHGAAAQAEATARQALAATLEGDMLRTALAGVRRFLRIPPVNLVPIRRALADTVVQQGGYPFG
jgi:alkylation response protein AidB-like acyl-CoA dehydrogenase